MLDLPRYLLGVAEVAVLVGFATLAASSLRARLLPGFSGTPAHLATALLALALLIWAAELLGAFGLFKPLPYLVAVGVVGLGLRRGVGGGWGYPSGAAASCFSPRPLGERRNARGEKPSKPEGHPHPPLHAPKPGKRGGWVAIAISLAIAAIAVVKFGLDLKPKLSTGMTGFDSTWYHGPFAAEFFQSGSTWDLHYIAPQFLAWFYPANAETFHAIGMLAFDRDLLSPLLNLGWFVGCLVAVWCIGRPFGVAPWSLALGAIALSVPALADQAGEARNDIVGIFFLLAAIAIAVNAQPNGTPRRPSSVRTYDRIATKSANSPMVAALAAGLAAGTKLNFLLPAAVLVLGLAMTASRGDRRRSLAVGGLAALAGGGYWYLRNLAHAGNPLPWIGEIGPISLPAPNQALGGREGHSVLGYLTDGRVWSDWFLPGLHDGLWFAWPVLLAAALTGLLLCLGRGVNPALRVAGLAGLAAALAWLIAPTSASGPEGMPRGFESGLRYLAPALVLGLAVLPAALLPRVARWRGSPMAEDAEGVRAHGGGPPRQDPRATGRPRDRTRGPVLVGGLVVLAAIAIGYPVQRHYLENRYTDPSFTTPGLNAAFKWASSISDARIATTSTRQYPLYGTDLSNQVQYIGQERPHGGFVPPSTCSTWRRLLNTGNYDYVVTSRDRIEPNKPPYPPTARWTEGPGANVVLREPPTVVFQLADKLDPSACR